MRRFLFGRVEYQADNWKRAFDPGWLQAGLSGFAYRLAHLRGSRASVLLFVSGVFYFF